MRNRILHDRIQELQEFELRFAAQYGHPFRFKDFDLLQERRASDPAPIQLTFTKFMREQIERERPKIIQATYTSVFPI